MKQIVEKITPEIDRRDVLCTTYQMRNFYKQFGGAFFSVLDVMNYIQHHQITKYCKAGMHVLDVCCGRGLMLPLLRYKCKNIASYTGIDIEPKNAVFTTKRVHDSKPVDTQEYYPFDVFFVNANVSNMTSKLDRRYDLAIYTSSIEHMHPDDGKKSLVECREVLRDESKLILSCPTHDPAKSGYETRYAAHVYEWSYQELIAAIAQSGFRIVDSYGVLCGKRELKEKAEKEGWIKVIETIEKHIPYEWLVPVFAPLLTSDSKEIAFICEAI